MTAWLAGVRGRHAGLMAPLRDRDTRLLLAAFLVSELGDGLSAIVVPLGVYGISGSVTLLASTFAGRLLLGSAFAALGGWAADRWSRRGLLIGSFVVRALLVLSLIGLDGNTSAFVGVGLLVGALGSFDNPAAEALLRSVFRADFQALAAVRKVGRGVSGFVGPALGGLLVGLGGSTLALAVDAGTFVVALFLIILVRRGARPETVGASPPVDAGHGVIRLREVLRASPAVPPAFVSSALGNGLVALAVSLAIPYLDGLPDAPEGAYGYVLAAYAIGSLIGLWLAGLVRWRQPLRRILMLAAVGYGLLCALSVVSSAWITFGIAWALWGIAYGPEDVVGDARVAESVPEQALGRVYGSWLVITQVFAGLGYVGVALVAWAEPRTVLLVVGIAYAVAAPLVLAVAGRFTGRRESFSEKDLDTLPHN